MKSLFIQAVVFTVFAFFQMNNVLAQDTLSADGPGETYELISDFLAPGNFPLEPPDCSHEDFGRHIDEVWDTTLNEYVFRFYMHVTPDNDRCINFDRQRNEIKVYNPSPAKFKGFDGDKMVYSWKMKLPEGFQSSSGFTHIHQLKAVGGNEDGMPLITLTPRKGNPDKIQLRYAEHTSAQTLSAFPVNEIEGVWVNITESVTYGENGKYEISINKVADNELIFHYINENIRMWRTGTSFIRPKWGIYRSLNHPEDLRDEEILMNDFYIKKVNVNSIEDKGFIKGLKIYPNPARDNVNFLYADKSIAPVGVYDIFGKKVLELAEDAMTVSVKDLNEGIYFIKFKTGNLLVAKKLIIAR